MANVTEISTSGLVSYISYIVSGTLLVIFNGLIVFTILVYPKMRGRKEYFIIMSMGLADFFNGIGYFMAGVWRLHLVLSNKQFELMTTWQCLLKPFNIVWIWAEPASYTMLLCISVDRIIAVAYPVYYFKSRVSYAYKLVGVFWGLPLLCALISIVSALITPDSIRYEAICFTFWAVGPSFQSYYENLPVFCGAGSVLLYLLIPAIYKRKKVQVQVSLGRSNSISLSQRHEDLRLQHRLSVTMGYAAACTVLFFLAPKFVHMLVNMRYNYDIPHHIVMRLAPPIYVLPHFNPLCNMALYTWRHMKFRKVLKCFLKGKPLPGNFNTFKG